MQVEFYKYQGTGNDFVIIDNRNLIFPKENIDLIHKICDRKFGIGADGLMLLENDEATDFRMVYYNADGREGTMCGNGGRCITAFAHQLGVAKNKGTFIAVDGLHEFEINNELIHLKMIDVDTIQTNNADKILFTGSPHYVSFVDAVNDFDVVTAAKKIRYNDTYAKEGINVNFVSFKNDEVYMRTYERGVEDETLSCGTGTVAVALCVAEQKAIQQGQISVHTPGGNLSVAFQKVGTTYENIWLIGPATFVFSGKINLNIV